MCGRKELTSFCREFIAVFSDSNFVLPHPIRFFIIFNLLDTTFQFSVIFQIWRQFAFLSLFSSSCLCLMRVDFIFCYCFCLLFLVMVALDSHTYTHDDDNKFERKFSLYQQRTDFRWQLTWNMYLVALLLAISFYF